MYLKFLGLVTAVILPVYNIIFPIIVDEQYSKAKDIIPLFLLFSVLSAYLGFIGNIFYALRNTKPVFFTMLISCILNVIICTRLVNLIGLNVASLSSIISLALCIQLRYIVIKRIINFKFNAKIITFFTIFLFLSNFMFLKCDLLVNIVWLILVLAITEFVFKDLGL